jgi:hypothetical protein
MKKRHAFLLLAVPIAAAGGLTAYNYIELQQPLEAQIAADIRNSGVSVWCHHRNFIPGEDLVFDLRNVRSDKSPADVFRVVLWYAHAMKDHSFGRVWLQHRGADKFFLDGGYFQRIGEEFDIQNPVYTIRTFPEHLRHPDGSPAFSQWSGGLIGVMGKQMEDFNRFHRQWYIDDL